MILGGNDTILLAPYHTFYSNVEEHMNKIGVGSSRNLWDQPLCVGKFVKCSHRLIILINNMAMQSFVNDTADPYLPTCESRKRVMIYFLTS